MHRWLLASFSTALIVREAANLRPCYELSAVNRRAIASDVCDCPKSSMAHDASAHVCQGNACSVHCKSHSSNLPKTCTLLCFTSTVPFTAAGCPLDCALELACIMMQRPQSCRTNMPLLYVHDTCALAPSPHSAEISPHLPSSMHLRKHPDAT